MNERVDHAFQIVRRILGVTDGAGTRSRRATASIALFPFRVPLRIARAAHSRWHRLVALGGTIAEVAAELAQAASQRRSTLRAVSISSRGGQRTGGRSQNGSRSVSVRPSMSRSAPSATTGRPSRAADEKTIRRIAERQVGGTSSSVSVEEFREKHQGGTHRQRVSREARDSASSAPAVGDRSPFELDDPMLDLEEEPRPPRSDGGLSEKRSGAS